MKPKNTCPDCHGPLTVEYEVMTDPGVLDPIGIPTRFIGPFAGRCDEGEGEYLSHIYDMTEIRRTINAWVEGELSSLLEAPPETAVYTEPYCAVCAKHWPVEHFAPPPSEPEDL